MPTSVTLPSLGEGVTEGTISRWLKRVGDHVNVGEPIVEVSTDKVDTEIPSPVSGIVLEIRFEEDAVAEVGGVLAVVVEDTELMLSGPTAPAAPPVAAPPVAAPPAAAPPAVAPPQAAPTLAAAFGGPVEPHPFSVDEAMAAVDRALGVMSEPIVSVPVPEIPEIPVPAPQFLAPTAAPQPPAQTFPPSPPLAPQPSPPQPSVPAPGPEAPPAPATDPEVALKLPAFPSTDIEPSPEPAAAAASAEAYVTPAVRKLASETGVDLQALAGSGVGGRIRKQDVVSAAEAARQAEIAQQAELARQAELAQAELAARKAELARAELAQAELARAELARAELAQAELAREAETAKAAELARETAELAREAAESARGAKPPRTEPSVPESAKRGTTEHLPRMRGTMARRMVESLQTSAHATATIEVDLTAVTKLRASIKEKFRTDVGVRLNYLPFVAVAVAEALRRYPKLNASIDTDAGTIAYPDDECLGITVDTEHGSIVPVVKRAGKLDVTSMAQAIASIVDRTHASQITPDDLVDGTFTITNYGATGTLFDTPVINQPQVAILGIGALARRPMVVDDPNVGQVVAIRDMVYLSLSYDRRLVDAVDAARFLGHVKARLERADFTVKFGA